MAVTAEEVERIFEKVDREREEEEREDAKSLTHQKRSDSDRHRGSNQRGRGGRQQNRGGYHGKRDAKVYDRNIKTRYDKRPESKDAEEIRRQVEFYFSDSNLPIDKFLLNEVGGQENRPVPLTTIHNFKRMRHFQPFSAVVEAVKSSNLLTVNEKDEVTRKEPLHDRFTDDVDKNREMLTSASMKRSVYAKGFGDEDETTVFDIEEFFKPYGIKSVRLRRLDNKIFKGSVFVEFQDEETANSFLNLEEKPLYKGNTLVVKSKKDYVDGKNEDIKEGRVQPKSPNRHEGRFNKSPRDSRGSKRGFKRSRDDNNQNDDSIGEDDWRARRKDFQEKRRKVDPEDDKDAKEEDPKAKGEEQAAVGAETEEKKDDVESKQVSTEESTEKKVEEGEAAAAPQADTTTADAATEDGA